jgi:hypothetical protein
MQIHLSPARRRGRSSKCSKAFSEWSASWSSSDRLARPIRQVLSSVYAPNTSVAVGGTLEHPHRHFQRKRELPGRGPMWGCTHSSCPCDGFVVRRWRSVQPAQRSTQRLFRTPGVGAASLRRHAFAVRAGSRSGSWPSDSEASGAGFGRRPGLEARRRWCSARSGPWRPRHRRGP